jgi:catechol 2,3-dioxygenase-like lactoylglutathione lyase family enzyme
MTLGMHHVGMSVRDLDRSIAFYRDGFGMDVVEQGTFGGEQYNAILGLVGATGRVALLRAGEVQVEVFEFSRPKPALTDAMRPVADHGITHFCIEVVDIEAKYERLIAAGAVFHCRPLLFFGSIKATYGRDPDGNVFELVERIHATE